MSYRMFNPYSHLTESFTLTTEEWERIKVHLSKADLDTLENGGDICIGKAARIWKEK